MKAIRTIAILILAVSVVAIATHQSPSADRYVNVVATGTVKVVPDAVQVSANISNLAPTSAASIAATAKSTNLFRTFLTNNGVEAKYIASANLSTNPEYSYPTNAPAKISGYRTTQQFTVIVRDATNAGTIVQNLQTQVGNSLSINSTSPIVLQQSAAESSARKIAIASARIKADSYARLSGAKLGKILSIDESVTQSFPQPLMATMAKSVGAQTPVQIDLGQQDITITVTTKWALK